MTDIEYLREACRYAVEHSQDPRTQNGAVLRAGARLVYGANRFTGTVFAKDPAAAVAQKYTLIEHAERDAIYRAAAAGVATAGATLYCPWFACTDCARAIILAGIREVVGLMPLRRATPARWEDNILQAEMLLFDAGVSLRWLAGPVGAKICFNGEVVEC
jgi:dCMP deaminase